MKKITGFVANNCNELRFPTYADDKVMMIGGWDEPMNTLEDYQFAKDMGLTMMFLGGRFARRGTEAFANALGYCEKVGLDAFITVGNALHTEFSKESWANDTTDYSQYPAVKAINYWDEPWYKNFKRVGELIDEHIEKYGDKINVFINHFPNTADGAFGGLSYSQFIGEFVDKILLKIKEDRRYLSADIYPLEIKNGENIIRSNWLGCIETIAIHAKRAKALPHFFIQTTEHETDDDIHYRAVTEADFRFQFFVNMAFGVQAFSYFTYGDSFCKGFSNSCVKNNESCSPHPQYYWAQKINKEMHAFDNVYLSFAWNGTMPVIGKNNTSGTNANFDGLSSPLASVDCLQSVTATEDALIGQFKDKDGNDGLIVTNFTNPIDEKRNEVTLQFKNANRARVYYKGEYKDYLVTNNEMTISLNAGDGVFVIAMND